MENQSINTTSSASPSGAGSALTLVPHPTANTASTPPTASSVNLLPSWFAADASGDVLHNLYPAGQNNEALVMMARSGSHKSMTEAVGEVIALSGFLCHPVQLVDTNGQIVDLVRCVFVSENYDMFEATGSGLRESLKLLINMRGLGFWDPPVRVKVASLKTRRGFMTYTLLPDISHLKPVKPVRTDKRA